MTTDRILPRASLGQVRPSAAPAASLRGVAPFTAASAPARLELSRHRHDRSRRAPGPAREAGVAAAARLAKPRGDALFSTATRAGMLIGVSAAVYAVSLGAVSGLQAQAQADAAAAAQPALDALSSAKASNDAVDAAIRDADARLQALTSDYTSASADMSAYQAKFEQLSSLVAKIQGTAAAMNANFKLPAVTMRGAVGGGGGSTVVTTTGASGKP